MTIGMDCRLDASWTKKQKRISSLLPARAKGANPLPRFPAGSLDRSGVDGACAVALRLAQKSPYGVLGPWSHAQVDASGDYGLTAC